MMTRKHVAGDLFYYKYSSEELNIALLVEDENTDGMRSTQALVFECSKTIVRRVMVDFWNDFYGMKES